MGIAPPPRPCALLAYLALANRTKSERPSHFVQKIKRSTRALVNVNAAVHTKKIMQIRAAEQSQATAPSEGQVVFSRLHGAGAAWFRGCLFPLFCRG